MVCDAGDVDPTGEWEGRGKTLKRVKSSTLSAAAICGLDCSTPPKSIEVDMSILFYFPLVFLINKLKSCSNIFYVRIFVNMKMSK